MEMIGRRIYPDEKGSLALRPGDYGKDKHGEWIARTPNGLTGSLKNHEVMEHEDGTITVSPSILVSGGDYPDSKDEITWHGYLEKGMWREV
jgi:hypothetical protein